MEPLNLELQELIKDALEYKKFSLARLISIFENKNKASIEKRFQILDSLEKNKKKKAFFLGFTGTPGVGKSSLINVLIQEILQKKPSLHIAIIAVDPSSAISGGSFLGDRERIERLHSIQKENVFFRSQASNLELGGISQNTYLVSRLLYYLFDFVFIETVGIGQNEIEIQHIADQTILLLQPESGDQLQFLKAGIMEVPNFFVINKCDLSKSIYKTLHLLKNSIKLSHNYEKKEIPILLTSTTKKTGISELSLKILELRECENLERVNILDIEKKKKNWLTKESYYLEKWIRKEFGNYGFEKIIKEKNNIQKLLAEEKSYEKAQLYCLNFFLKKSEKYF